MVHPVGGLRLCAFVLFLITQAARVDAGVGRWSRIGPFASGGITTALAIDPQHPDNVYVGTTGGIFKSSNGGAEWRSVNDGLSGTITDLIVVPGSGETLYATSFSDGVFKTTDGGDHWTAINNGLAVPSSGNTAVSSIAIDRLSPSTLYVGTSGYPGGMFKSTDGGAIWTRLFLEGDPPVYGIAVDPFDASRVFAATDRGVYRTRDGGASWEPRNAGLGLDDDGLGGSAVTLVETDPSSARSLFAGTSKGVFRSLDGGETWGSINSGLPPGLRPLALAFSGSTGYVSMYSGGVFRSLDGGASWLPASVGLRSPYVSSLAIDPRDDSTVYAAMQLLAEGGVAKSVDRAASWTTVPGRFRPVRVLDLVLDPNSPSRLYSATEIGVLRSDDGGQDWSQSTSGLPAGEVWRLAIDTRSSDLYAAANASPWLFKSSDGGSRWIGSGSGLPVNQSVFSITVVPKSSTSTVYVGLGYSGLFKSADGGQSWTSLGPAETTITSVAGDARSPLLVNAGTSDGRIFRSTDGGASWATAYTQANRGINCMKIDPLSLGTIYAGWGYSGPAPGGFVPPGGILKSTDSGATWRELSGGPSLAVGAIAIDARLTSRIYAGTVRGFWRSVDAGETWMALAEGLPRFMFVQAIEIDPQDKNTLYAGILEAPDSGGVFKLTLGPDRVLPILPCQADDCHGRVGVRPQTRVVSPRNDPPLTP